jgi:hypothetical protein
MGHTYRKEKTFDDRHGHKQKKNIVQDVERKQSKNVRVDDYFEEDEFDYEYSDDIMLDKNRNVRYNK